MALSQRRRGVNFNILLRKVSWASRAWTFQERVLACRVLYYGHRQLYWQCREGYQSADGIPEGNDTPQSINYPELAKHLCEPLETKSSIDARLVHDEWYKLAAEYSSKSITFDSDGLRALAGLEAKFAELTNDEYLAGLWK